MTPHLAFIPSPPQGVWHLGGIALRAYAGFIILGIILGVIWSGRRYVARGGKPGRIADLAVWAVPFGLIGGRAYHVITDHELYFGEGKNPWRAFAIWEGGLGIWGAIALGGLGIWIGCRRYKIPMAPVADAMAPGIVLAQAIGRLGNYFNQELFGSPTTLPWGLEVFVRTPGGVASNQTFAVGSCEFPTDYIKASPEVLCGAGTYHPTFLYELIWNLLVVALIVWADRRFKLGGGRVFALYVAGYTAGRAWIEALRIDPARTHLFGLRVNIVVSIVVFVLAVIYLLARRRATREDPAVVRGTADDDAPATAESADDDDDDDDDEEPQTGLDATERPDLADTSSTVANPVEALGDDVPHITQGPDDAMADSSDGKGIDNPREYENRHQ